VFGFDALYYVESVYYMSLSLVLHSMKLKFQLICWWVPHCIPYAFVWKYALPRSRCNL